MASGNSGRNSSGSKGFDFAATDDILCSYEDYADNHESSNGNHSDPGIGDSSGKEFRKTRMARTPTFPSSYISSEESINRDVISSVEMTMKKYTDNIVRFLEGISSRLSQLELYCYNLDKSIGEMRTDLGRDNAEAETKLKSLEKHLQEVHRSVQILRDKQELADAQTELSKLHLAQKEPASSTGHSKQNEDTPTPQTSDTNNTDNSPDPRSQQLALALPHQVAPQSQLQTISPSPPQAVAPPQSYYIQNPPQGQYLSPDSPYRTQQAPPQPPAQPQANQPPSQFHPLPPQYQQQWPQQATPQPPSMQPQMRPSASTAYPPYLPNQPANPSSAETMPSSFPMQVPYSGISQPGGNRVEPTPYGYGGPTRPTEQPPPPQQLKSQYGNDGYTASGPHPSLSSGNAYMMYPNEGGRTHQPHQHHYGEGTYPQPGGPPQGPSPNAGPTMARPPQFSRGHPYNELIDKLVSMGYRGDHVASVIQRLEENGQSVDFNAVLDILNGNSSGGSQRGWSS